MIQHSGRHLRKFVLKRDRGVCRNCGLDCVKLRREMRKLRSELGRQAIAARVSTLNLFNFKLGRAYWDADHIIPVWEGGGQCDLSNIQTLCLRCHHLKTLAEAKRRAKKARAKRAANGTVRKQSPAAKRQAKFFAKRAKLKRRL
jgi:5-methylcytosine-specific restriction endonuclease McrA